MAEDEPEASNLTRSETFDESGVTSAPAETRGDIDRGTDIKTSSSRSRLRAGGIDKGFDKVPEHKEPKRVEIVLRIERAEPEEGAESPKSNVQSPKSGEQGTEGGEQREKEEEDRGQRTEVGG